MAMMMLVLVTCINVTVTLISSLEGSHCSVCKFQSSRVFLTRYTPELQIDTFI